MNAVAFKSLHEACRTLACGRILKTTRFLMRNAVHTDMQIKLPHQGTKEEGKARIKEILKSQEKEIAKNATDVKTEWNGDILSFEFSARGMHVSGTVTVTDTEYDIYAKLPLSLRLFEGKIERMIAQEAAKLKM